jgi:hypothetical protein
MYMRAQYGRTRQRSAGWTKQWDIQPDSILED